MTWRHSLLAVLSLAMCGVAGASEQSEILYSKGLVRFHAGQYQEALVFFEQAVESDPNDAYARYYRGVTRGRLGDLDGAIQDLRVTVERKPEFKEATLELGVALVDANRPGEAIPWLEQAQEVPGLEGQASFFLGIAQLRTGQEEAAEANFERAARADPSLATSSMYYRGVAAYQAARWAEAEERFRAVTKASPGSRLGREAAEFIAAIEGGGVRPFQLYADLALGYDSNVTIAPDNQTIKQQTGISEEDAGFADITAGGSYAPIHTNRVLLNLGYEFFQSFYFNLSKYDLQNHRVAAEVVGRVDDFRLGLLGRYDYYSLDFDSFLNEATAYPWVILYNGSFSQLEVFYRMRYRDFLDSDFDLRTGFNHATGARNIFNLGDWDRFLSIGYQYDHEDPNGSSDSAQAFGYDGQEVSVGLGWTFPAEIWGNARYAYRRERYNDESGGRRDNEHRIFAELGKELTDWLIVRCSYFGTINDSNQNVYQYDRHIFSTSFEVRY